MKAHGIALVTVLLASSVAVSAAQLPPADFLLPRAGSGWDNGAYGGKGFHIQVERSNALVGSPIAGSGTTVAFRVMVMEFNPNIIPALDQIQFVSPCGPSVAKNRDGTFWYSRTDETHFGYRGGIFTTLPGQKVPADPLLIPKGTYLFHLYLSADAAKIQQCTLRFSRAFNKQDNNPVPDLSFGRVNNVSEPQQPVP